MLWRYLEALNHQSEYTVEDIDVFSKVMELYVLC